MFNRKIRRVVWTTVAWMAVAVLIALYDHLAYLSLLGTAPYDLGLALLTGVGGALIGGGLGAALTVFYLQPRGRGHSFLRAVVTHTVTYIALIAAMIVVLTFFFQAQLVGAPILSGQVISASSMYLSGAGPAKFMMIWVIVAGATSVSHAVSDHFGPGLFKSFVLGRYRTPKVEERTFMFLDLVGSTTIAERLGHVRYFELLQTLFGDITESLVDHGAQIYQYVGDEVVVTWLGEAAFLNSACVSCYVAIERMLEECAGEYEVRFDVRPRFRAGVHTGLVTTGEVGRLRTDIVHSGDVLNTAARIQGQAKEADAPILISGTVATRIDPSQWRTESLGELALKGKAELVEVHRVHSRGSAT